MVRRFCSSTDSGPIPRPIALSFRHLIGRYRTTQPDPTAPTGFATPLVGLVRQRFPGRRARRRFPGRHGRQCRQCRLGRRARQCRLGLLRLGPAGHHLALRHRIRPASTPVPCSVNLQCHAGAENQTVFEGS
jgi:hypothetical protein